MQPSDPNTAPTPRGPRLSTRRKVLFMFVALALFWAVLEAAFAFAYPRLVPFNIRLHQLSLTDGKGRFMFRFASHPYTVLYPAPNLELDGFKQHNSLGFRGPEVAIPKPAGVFRILCLGGSTTYSSNVPDPSLAYPRQMEGVLRSMIGADRIEVVNGGITYATSAEILGTFALRGLELDPDLIVINEGGNDIDPFLAPGYKLDYTHWRRSWVAEPPSLPLRFALHSYIVRTIHGLRLRNEALSERFQYYPSRTGWAGDAAAEEFARTHAPAAFRNNIESVILMARGRGIDVALVNFAFAPQFDLAQFPAAEIALAKNRAVFAELAAKYTIPLIRFETNKIPPALWVDNAAHLNAEGDAMKARIIAEGIAPLVRKRMAGGH